MSTIRRRWSALSGVVAGLAVAVGPALECAAHPPAGFADRALSVSFDQAVGLCFDYSGRMYVWEKAGKVWTVDGIRDGALGGERHPTPLIDLSEEVANWGDHGLLAFALDPNFAFNGYIYLFYAVDYHHLQYFGTPEYHPDWSTPTHDTIARLTRYTVREDDNFLSVDPDSRLVLIGVTKHDGFPICYISHSTGSLVFGEDGTLLVSFGDSSGYAEADVGGPVEGWNSTCLSDGIIRAEDEDVGALRAQLLTSLSGKVLRIDPSNGAGVASNPFYDAKDPQSTISKVWAWGLRNPYRFTLRPGTGAFDPGAGDPGTIYLGDVGWSRWEELDVIREGGHNLGWPLFEGLEAQDTYMQAAMAVGNALAPNPLYDPKGGCAEQYFAFPELIRQDTLNTPSWPNPCDGQQQVPAQASRVEHTRPVFDWYHFEGGPSRTATYDGNGNATQTALDAPGSPVPGPRFEGATSIGGAWVTGENWPEEWRNTYFHGDFVGEWIKAFNFDGNDQPTLVRDFMHDLGSIVDLEWDETRGALWYVRFTRTGVCEVRAIVPDDDLDPFAVAAANPVYGPGPLNVSFSSAGSADPEGGGLTYHWEFGDGAASDQANPSHVYAPSGGPDRYDATLTVTDPLGQEYMAGVSVWVDNTPPVIEISSPLPGATMPPSGFGVVQLEATVTDAEQAGPGGVTCRWLAILHHNVHTHLVAIINACDGSVQVSPHPCEEGSTYSYEFLLEATDSLGLVATGTREMFPADCNNNGSPDNCDIAAGEPDLNFNGIPDVCEKQPKCPADFDGNGVVNSTDVSEFIGAWFADQMNGTLITDFDGNGVVNSTDVSDFINAYFETDPLCLT